MKNILTLTDFSQVAESAVESAFVFADQYNADLSIYHNGKKGTLTEYDLNKDSIISIESNLTNAKDSALDRWRYLSDKYKVNVSIIIGNGDIYDNVATVINNKEIDLVIMGSTGAGGKEEYIWGSTTEKVIQEIDCPVLVIKRPMSDYRIDNIVFASSFDTSEREVLQYALDLLSPPQDARIHLLSIDTLSYFTQPTVIMKQAMKEFENICKPYHTESHFYKDYSVDAGIRHFLEEIKPDVLIMSNKNSNPIKRFIKGSNTIRAVNHADFPVLTVDYK